MKNILFTCLIFLVSSNISLAQSCCGQEINILEGYQEFDISEDRCFTLEITDTSWYSLEFIGIDFDLSMKYWAWCQSVQNSPITVGSYINARQQSPITNYYYALGSDSGRFAIELAIVNLEEVESCENLLIENNILNALCADPTSCNYNGSEAVWGIPDEECYYFGCLDSEAINYNPNASFSDESCEFGNTQVLGCTDNNYTEYNSEANTDDGSCATAIVLGCTDNNFTEHNSEANTDDGSCVTAIVLGCTDNNFTEYNSEVNTDDGSCATAIVLGCTDNNYTEYNSEANTDDGSCATAIVLGCTDNNFTEYNSEANTDDSSCVTEVVLGCINEYAFNYSSLANISDESCEFDNLPEFTCNEHEALLTLYDSEGDGWEGAMLAIQFSTNTVNGSSSWYNDSFTLSEGSFTQYCVDDGCFSINTIAALNMSQSSFTLSNESEIIVSETLPYTGVVGDDCSFLIGIHATGCTDSLATNFLQHAIQDDGSCIYPPDCNNDLISIELFRVLSIGYDGGGWVIGGGYPEPVGINFQDSTYIFDVPGNYITGVQYYDRIDACVDLSECSQLSVLGGGISGNNLFEYSQDFVWRISNNDEIIIAGDSTFSSSIGDCDDCASGQVPVFLEGGENQDEISWEIYNCSGNMLYSGGAPFSSNLNLPDNYQIVMYDSYGDGWGANRLFIGCTSYTLGSGSSMGYEIIGECLSQGCTDIYADNYDENSFIDDGTCDYSCPLNYSGYDYTYSPCYYLVANQVYTLEEANYYGLDCSCVNDNMKFGCTNEFAANYDPQATEEDWSCQYECQDNETELTIVMSDSFGDGWNGNVLSIGNQTFSINGYNDGYESSSSVCVDLSQCNQIIVGGGEDQEEISWSIGDLSGGAPFTGSLGECQCSNTEISVGGGDFQEEVSWTISDCDGNNLVSGGAPWSDCVELPDNIVITLSDSWGDGWSGNSLSVGNNIYELSSGSEVQFIMGSCGSAGCTSPSASNYNIDADIDDGSCVWDCPLTQGGIPVEETDCYDAVWNYSYSISEVIDMGYDCSCVIPPIKGCTDPEASNYNQLANQEGSCTYDCLENETSLLLSMIDSYGDGWNGASLTIGSNSYFGPENGQSETLSVCVDLSICNQIYVGGGSNDEEISWSLIEIQDNIIGCTDPSADSYNPLAITDDGSCDSDSSSSEYLVNVTINTVDWANEVSWSLIDEYGVEVFSGNGYENYVSYVTDLYLNEGASYTFEARDSYGDGWNGTTFSISSLSCELLSGTLVDGNFTQYVFTTSCANENQTYIAVGGAPFIDVIGSCENIGPSEQSIDLPSGWSIFSTYIYPINNSFDQVLAPLLGDLEIAKDYLGLSYIPQYNFNAVGNISNYEGYQIKMNSSRTLNINGVYTPPEGNPIQVPAGWSIISYLRTEPASADAVLSDIASAGNLLIAKDFTGNAYLPEWGFNGIGNMVPGRGYQIKTVNEDVLQYLSNDDSYRMSALEVTENNVSHYAKAHVTDNNMIVVIEDAAWDVLPTEGSEIAAFDKNGNMVGSAIYSSPVTVVTVWGDDATTTSKDGMLVSESVSFKVWNTNEVRDFSVVKWIEGSSSYQVDGISVASTIETNNVMAELNASERVLVKVINVLGQEVNLDDQPFKGTVLFNVYDDGSVEKFVY